MTTLRYPGVAIRGVWGVVPGKPQDVRAFGAPFSETELEKAVVSVGLGTVYRVTAEQTTSDLCVAAARRLLDQLKWDVATIDGVISVTQTPDFILPGNAHVAHRELGLPSECLALDLELGCSGYTYALSVAAGLLQGGAKKILILAGDTISKIVDPNDKGTVLLFGDAGTATAIEFDSSAAESVFVLGAKGEGVQDLIVPAGGFRCPASGGPDVQVGREKMRAAARTLAMDGMSIFNFTSREVPALLRASAAAKGWEIASVDRLLLHQANGMILEVIRKKVGTTKENIPSNMKKFGNTSVASIPMLIADKEMDLFPGGSSAQTIMAGFGVGFSWASAAMELQPTIVRGLDTL